MVDVRRGLSGRVLATAGALLLGAVIAGPVHGAETVKLSEVSHLHGIAVDAGDPSRLYLASHHGVWLTSITVASSVSGGLFWLRLGGIGARRTMR